MVPQESNLAEDNYVNIIDQTFQEQLETPIKSDIRPESVLPIKIGGSLQDIRLLDMMFLLVKRV